MANENTEANARAIYEESKAALEAIISDLSVEQAVADEAQRQLEDLGMEFAAAAWDRIEARTANLQAIASKLKLVIEAAGQDSAADALDHVTGITSGLAGIAKRIDTLIDDDDSGADNNPN